MIDKARETMMIMLYISVAATAFTFVYCLVTAIVSRIISDVKRFIKARSDQE